jgi:hypothetical protein
MVYRLPRDPSAPRLAVWRALRRLGAVRVTDGLVALPLSARNQEHLEWLAADIEAAHGTAAVWRARLTSTRAGDVIVEAQRRERDAEYRRVLAAARSARLAPADERRRTLRRLRAELRRIGSRDYFGVASGERAREAVERLATDRPEEVSA